MAWAAEEVTIDAVNFPDEIFREYVASKFDKDNNGKLSEKGRTKFSGITETKRASKQDEKKIGNIMGSDCNYSMSSSFSYKLFLS